MTEISRRGLLLVMSSPSGAGKTTITRALVAAETGIAVSVSVTTRPPREGEINGTHYHFITQARFDEMVRKDELLEHAIVFGHCYGTPRAPVMAALGVGRDIVMDVDWQGTRQLKKTAHDLVSVFILPPSRVALQDRLERRAQDSAEVVAARMAKAAHEMEHWDEYDYVIVNRDLDESVRQARAILVAERAKRDRQPGLAGFVTLLRAGQ
jgi:guanylate kinase